MNLEVFVLSIYLLIIKYFLYFIYHLTWMTCWNGANTGNINKLIVPYSACGCFLLLPPTNIKS